MKIFITGGTGFVGSHLIRELTKNSEHEIFYLCRNLDKAREKNLKGTPIQGSLHQLSNISELPKDLDIVIHLASVVHSHDSADFHFTNVLGTRNLIKSLSEEIPNSLNFVLISSLAAIGPADNVDRKLDEDDLPIPVSEYGRSKLEQEKILKSEIPSHWEYSILRPPMVIGPEDDAIGEIIGMVKKGIKIVPGLKGEQKQYSFISVFDLVRSIVIIIENQKNENRLSDTYFVSHPQIIRYGELFYRIEKSLEKRTFRLIIPKVLIRFVAFFSLLIWKVFKINSRITLDKIHEISPDMWICSSQKFEKIFNFKFLDNLDKTIEKTLK